MNLSRLSLFALTAMTLLILTAGCSERNPTELDVGRATIDPIVFDDALSDDVYFQPFFETHYTAMSVDSVFAYDGFAPDGARSLKFNVPPAGSALGPYMGGVLTSSGSRDFADFNALTFYARAGQNITLNTAGFGNDNSGNSLYDASRPNIPLTGEWTIVVLPVPAPSKLIAERGLFTIAEGLEEPYVDGYDVWIDELKFAKLSNIVPVRPAMPFVYNDFYFIGSIVNISGCSTIFQDTGGGYIPMNHSSHYFDYSSSDPAVAVADGSTVTVIGAGEAKITGTLENPAVPEEPFPVQGEITVTGFHSPTVAATAPTHPAGDVISMFSDVYSDVLVDTWRGDWPNVTTQVEDYVVAQDNTKMYTSLNWVGVEFLSRMIDASDMTHFHLDLYVPGGTEFKFFLVSFPDGGADGVPTVEQVLNADSTPVFVNGSWMSVDIPLADMQNEEGTVDWSHLGQLVFASDDARLVLVDNIYFRK